MVDSAHYDYVGGSVLVALGPAHLEVDVGQGHGARQLARVPVVLQQRDQVQPERPVAIPRMELNEVREFDWLLVEVVLFQLSLRVCREPQHPPASLPLLQREVRVHRKPHKLPRAHLSPQGQDGGDGVPLDHLQPLLESGPRGGQVGGRQEAPVRHNLVSEALVRGVHEARDLEGLEAAECGDIELGGRGGERRIFSPPGVIQGPLGVDVNFNSEGRRERGGGREGEGGMGRERGGGREGEGGCDTSRYDNGCIARRRGGGPSEPPLHPTAKRSAGTECG